MNRRTFLGRGLKTAVALLLGSRAARALSTRRANFVQFLWSGALTPSSIQIRAKLDHDSDSVYLLVSDRSDLGAPQRSGPYLANFSANNRVVAMSMTNLLAGTHYYYAVEADGLLDERVGQFETPASGPFSFTVAFASCAQTGSNHPIFDTLRQHPFLFFLHLGDFHYRDIALNDRNLFRQAYDTVLDAPRQAALFRERAIAYIWDDHDYGPNDSDSQSPSRQAARLTYQEYVPHYPLVAGSGDVPIYQAFSVGRVRFILTDTRSERDTTAVSPDDPNKSMLGAVQKAWFKQELLTAQNSHAAIVWASTSPWIADSPGSGIDNWNGFRAERRELADFIRDNGLDKLVMVSGDVHMLAIDDGSNNSYASGGGWGFPIMQAAPLDNGGSYFTTNTYSEGQYPGPNRFGLMTIIDDGGPKVRIQWSGRDVFDNEVVGLEVTVPPSPRLGVMPGEVLLTAVGNDPQPLNQTLTITNRRLGSLTWQIVVDPLVPWLTINTLSGTATPDKPAIVTLTVDPTGLPTGFYETTLQIVSPEATDSPQLVPVSLLVTDEPPVFMPSIWRS